ncbi:hypothetical protein CEG14_01580 [Bordetella genomosp. 1]|uniref:CopC domain-containing protein n=1 Tax=Bordetella genomosp. 1 TaxID=1395607 RepID=A0A261STK1_9BORD|nr:copper homeostasis periplasmic binding protein CopC [Bordetella genomosp. 1]OZI40485.1 hypothetical protein CEG14_01580 [Bordetella genomosp. 1]
MKALTLALAALALGPQLAWAHAHLKQSTPAAGSAAASPAAISATFTEGLEPAFSTLAVTGADGRAVDLGKAAPAPGDDKTLVLPVRQALPAGAYTVQWQVLSKDGHKTRGDWKFTVK